MKNIKLLCLDLDGTTLRGISSISDENINSIRKAYESGIKIALTTGRIFVHGMYFSSLLNIPTYVISNNGTYVYDQEKNHTIYSSFLGRDNLTKIHNYVKETHFSAYYSTIDTVYINNLLEFEPNEHEKGEFSMKEVCIHGDDSWENVFDEHGDSICKVVVTSQETEKLEKLIVDLKKSGEFEVEYSWLNTLEILKKGEGKGTGIRNLKKYLSLDSSEVMCIGDSENDLSMFKECGYKVAMGNAIDELKKNADFVTCHVLENGVSIAIERMLSNR